MATHPFRTRIALVAALVGVTALVLWSTDSATARPLRDAAPATANELVVEASDYAFTMPDTIAAGLTRIRLVNRGKELHHMYILRLEQGKRLGDLYAAIQGHGGHAPLPSWVREMGGPNSPVPGAEAEAIVDLAPGTYAVLCIVPSPDGTSHVMKGMSKEVTVLAGRPARRVEAPAPTVTMTLTDYDFTLDEPLTAGRHVLRVVNAAEQPHELILARLEPGKTAQDLLAWGEKMEGPPPGTLIGGTVGLEKGVENLVPVDLAPGEYALICFIPDHEDGKPHVAHGMVKQISVR